MTEAAAVLRPVRPADLWLFERQAVDPEACGEFNWSGLKDPDRVRRQHEQDGLLGPDGGRLIVAAPPEETGPLAVAPLSVAPLSVAGNVVWTRVTYGAADWWCWNIGIALLPEFRGRGIGTRAQSLLVAYLFDTTTAVRIEAYTDVENKAEQRALEKVGFSRDGVLRSAQFRGGRWCDMFLYSALRGEPTADPA